MGSWSSPYLQEAVEEGNIVGPFLEGRLKQRQGAFDAGGIFSVVLVL